MHTHKGSVGDSILKIEDAIKKAKELNISALAITDHGSMAAIVDFYEQCTKAGIKPIIGCEVYETDNRLLKEGANNNYNHLVLLAVNKQGYKDLLNIVHDSNINGFYYKPRTDINMLKQYGKNIIALSACIGGRIPKMIKAILKSDDEKFIDNTYENMIDTIELYKDIFHSFYLEIQPGNFEEQIEINKALVELSEITDTPLVITNDVHYLNYKDSKTHDQHLKIAKKGKDSDKLIYPDTCYYLMDYDDIKARFDYLDEDTVEEAIINTLIISEEIDLSNLYSGKVNMPKADIPEGYTEDEYLSKLVYEALEKKKSKFNDPSIYYARAEYELETLKEVGFSSYILIIKDITDYAKANHIPLGPGRGSVGGVLIAYLLGITTVDSIKYNLMFERFISKHRIGSVPDVDLDFSPKGRVQMFKYIRDKYGKDYVAKVSTNGFRKARAAIRDSSRLFDENVITPTFSTYVGKLIPRVWFSENGDDGSTEKETDLSIERSMEIIGELKDLKNDYEEWFDAAMRLEGVASTSSTHPAGILVSPIPLKDYIPLKQSNIEDLMQAELDLKSAEKAGALKIDFLSIATLEVINNTLLDVGIDIDLDDDEFYMDELVWNEIGSKNTTTLFQISSSTYKSRMYRLKPTSIQELANDLALLRGPCISANLDKEYMEILEGTREVELLHPFWDEVTKYTNGILLYQEDMIKILVNFGFTPERAFQIMKYTSKKKEDKVAEAKSEYDELCIKNKVDKNIAEIIWKRLYDMGLYSFNSGHATAYAIFSYLSAYLKVYYPLEWYSNALTNAYMDNAKEDYQIAEMIDDTKRLGIEFLPLDINISDWKFKVEDNKLRIGFVALKGVGISAFNSLLSLRSSFPIISIKDLLDRKVEKFNKTAQVLSIWAGAFDNLYINSNKLDLYYKWCEVKNEVPLQKITIKKSSFDITDEDSVIEEALFRTVIINDPVRELEPFNINDLNIGDKIEMEFIISRISPWKDKKKREMAFVDAKITSGKISCTIFASEYSKYKNNIKVGNVLRIKGEKSKDDSMIFKELIEVKGLEN